MLKYSRYLIFNFFKRVGVYVTVAISAIATLVFLYFSVSNHNWYIENGRAADPFVTLMPTTYFLFFIFLFMVMFLVLVIIHVFKQGEQDGTELLIVSKPISRITIIFSKFISSIILLALFQMFSLAVYFGVYFFDRHASIWEILIFAGSLALGGFIIGLIILSILIAFSSFMGRIGISVVSIFFAAIIPVASLVMGPMTYSQIPYDADEQKRIILSNIESKNKNTSTDPKYVYLNNLPEEKIGEEGAYDRGFSFQKTWNEYQNEVSYQNVVYVDFWYQWSRFYSMFFEENNHIIGNTINKLVKNEKTLNQNLTSDRYIDVDGKKYIVFSREKKENNDLKSKDWEKELKEREEDFRNFIFNALSDTWNQRASIDAEKLLIKAIKEFFEPFSYYQLDIKVPTSSSYSNRGMGNTDNTKYENVYIKNDNLQDSLFFIEIIQRVWDEIEDDKKNALQYGQGIYQPDPLVGIDTLQEYLDADKIRVHYLFNDYRNQYNFSDLNLDDDIFITYKKCIEGSNDRNIRYLQNDQQRRINYQNIFDLSKPVPVFEARPWMSTTMVIIVWSSISLAILSLAIFLYLKRDFK